MKFIIAIILIIGIFAGAPIIGIPVLAIFIILWICSYLNSR